MPRVIIGCYLVGADESMPIRLTVFIRRDEEPTEEMGIPGAGADDLVGVAGQQPGQPTCAAGELMVALMDCSWRALGE